MNFLLRLAGSYVDAVLNTFYPLEQERSMADVEREQEIREEFTGWWREQRDEEVGTGGRVDMRDCGLGPDADIDVTQLLADLYEEVCEIRQLLQSSVAPLVADGPGEVVPPADPGHPDDPMFWSSDLFGAAQTLLCMADGARRKPKDHDERLRALAHRLSEIGTAFKPYVTK